jgi:hypothetical protein
LQEFTVCLARDAVDANSSVLWATQRPLREQRCDWGYKGRVWLLLVSCAEGLRTLRTWQAWPFSSAAHDGWGCQHLRLP